MCGACFIRFVCFSDNSRVKREEAQVLYGSWPDYILVFSAKLLCFRFPTTVVCSCVSQPGWRRLGVRFGGAKKDAAASHRNWVSVLITGRRPRPPCHILSNHIMTALWWRSLDMNKKNSAFLHRFVAGRALLGKLDFSSRIRLQQVQLSNFDEKVGPVKESWRENIEWRST